ncbi:hypothetical protein QP938_09410 [Porticoccaceae bacterium LTM1]|nr:hypothetical protein QP938_09410 [Porticoccaceae bacterium LTM1]
MGFLITLFLTLLLVVVVLCVFMRLGTPTYRIGKVNIIRLLELVLAGQASQSDWDVFIGMPLRYDPELEAIRELCEDISEREFIGGRSLFTAQGLKELAELLSELKSPADN